MTQPPGMVATLDGYQLRLPSFEGPLDVLLRLIERDQLAISEISLLTVFDQFMAHLDAMEAYAPDAIAEFLMVAGRLSVLKSRALLPRPARPQEEPEEVDLVRQLEAYRAVKAAAELLAVRQRTGSGAFSRIRAICAGPQDTAVAFLAILTLMRRQAVIATQRELFGPINLARGILAPHASNENAVWDLDGTDGNGRRRT